MKATGIVRRIDDLGRVVIPKEIRRTMRIREGDPLEIYTDAQGEVIFKKYSPIGEMTDSAAEFAEVLAKDCTFGIAICDRDRVIAAAGVSKRETVDRKLTPELEALMESRRAYIYKAGEPEYIIPFDGLDARGSVIVPIIASGDIIGSVVLLMNEKSRVATDADIRLAKVAAGFLGRQMEE